MFLETAKSFHFRLRELQVLESGLTRHILCVVVVAEDVTTSKRRRVLVVDIPLLV